MDIKGDKVVDIITDEPTSEITENEEVVETETVVKSEDVETYTKDDVSKLMEDLKLQLKQEFTESFKDIAKQANTEDEENQSELYKKALLEKQKLENEIQEMLKTRELERKSDLVIETAKSKNLPDFIIDSLVTIEDDDLMKSKIIELDKYITKAVKKGVEEVINSNKPKTVGDDKAKTQKGESKYNFNNIFSL